jgi:hypothetical protein
VVTWRWEGVAPDGEVLGAGVEFVILAADGRIATDYQVVEPPSPRHRSTTLPWR